MSNSVDLAVVLESTNIMHQYVKTIKTRIRDIINIFDKQQLNITFVCYDEKDVKCRPMQSFCPIQKVIVDINKVIKVPEEISPVPSQKPIDALGAINKALSYPWKSNKRILLLIGLNPPYGAKHHQLGSKIDPNGESDENFKEIISLIESKRIDLYVANISDTNSENGLKKLCIKFEKGIETTKFKWTFVTDPTMTTEAIKKMMSDNDKSNKENDEKTGETFGWFLDGDVEFLGYIVEGQDIDNSGKFKVWDGEQYRFPTHRIFKKSSDKKDQQIEKLIKSSYLTSIENGKLRKWKQQVESETQTRDHQMCQALQFDNNSKIKWLYNKNENNCSPVLIVQKEKKEMVGKNNTSTFTTPMVVMDRHGNYHSLENDKNIWEFPPGNSDSILKYLKELKKICSIHGWKFIPQIKCRETRCEWKEPGKYYGQRTCQGTIMMILQANKKQTTVRVQNDTDHKLKTLNVNDLTIFYDQQDRKETMSQSKVIELSEKEKELNNIKQRLNATQNTLAEKDKILLKYEQKHKKFKQDVEKEQMNWKNLIDERQQMFEVAQKKNEIQMQQIKQLKTETDKTKQQIKGIHNKYEELEKQKQALNNAKSEKEKLVVKLSQRLEHTQKTLDEQITAFHEEKSKGEKSEQLVDRSNTFVLSDGFPPVQDIVFNYDTIRTQYHFEASKSIKQSLKKSNKYWSKTRYLKTASRLLFNILYKSYEAMTLLQKERLSKIAEGMGIDITNESGQNFVEKSMRKAYENILNEVKETKSQSIVLQCIKDEKLNGKLQKAMDNIESYSIECLKICWEIVLSRDPALKLHPLKFKGEEKEKIEFNDEIYEAGPRSETNESLNFVIWPSIVRNDTNHQLSKIVAVFLEEIPKWNRSKSKQLEQQREKQKDNGPDMVDDKECEDKNNENNAPDVEAIDDESKKKSLDKEEKEKEKVVSQKVDKGENNVDLKLNHTGKYKDSNEDSHVDVSNVTDDQ